MEKGRDQGKIKVKVVAGGEGKREGLSSPGERAEGGQKGTVSLEEALLCMILC